MKFDQMHPTGEGIHTEEDFVLRVSCPKMPNAVSMFYG